MTQTATTTAAKAPLQQVLQIAVVVEDLEKAMATYWEVFGIGPWQIYTLQPPEMTDATVRGRPQPYSMRLALAMVGNLQWELIQPLTGESIYKEFLQQRGGGLHHIACTVPDYEQASQALRQRGMPGLMGGTWRGVLYQYFDTEKVLGTIVELFNHPPDFVMPPPEATYPPAS